MIDIAAAGSDELLSAIRSNKRFVFTQLVTVYHSGMLVIARSFLRDHEAEEVVQEAWISIYKGLDRFEGRSTIRTWLTRIVINQAKACLRKSGREIRLESSRNESSALSHYFSEDGTWKTSPLDWEINSPEDLLQEEELMACLHTTLMNLPVNQRLVLELRDFQGFELEEICSALDVSASNVRVLLHRARATLYNSVDQYQRTGRC